MRTDLLLYQARSGLYVCGLCEQVLGEGCGAAMECGTVDGSELFV